MGLVTVRVYSIDENTDPLSGVLVQVYDNSDVFVTQNVTSITGGEAYAEFTLDGDDPAIRYTIRLSKVGVAFDGLLGDDSKTPQAIEIYDPPSSSPTGTNYFQIQGQTFVRPASTNPRLCKASGFFKDPAGRALPNLDIEFIPTFTPLIVDEYAVLGYHVVGRTDADGYFEVELYRTGEYQAVIESFEDVVRWISVPDVSSINIVNLLFPAVDSVVFTPSSVSIAVDETVDVDLTITTTSDVVLDPLDGDVLFTSDDTAIATAQLTDEGKLRILGRSVGTTNITATRADTSIVSIPDMPTASIGVTVT